MEKVKLITVSIIIGLLVSISYLFVEFIDTKGVDFLWNKILQTDKYRVLVIPVAIFLSIIFSWVILTLKQKRSRKVFNNKTNL